LQKFVTAQKPHSMAGAKQLESASKIKIAKQGKGGLSPRPSQFPSKRTPTTNKQTRPNKGGWQKSKRQFPSNDAYGSPSSKKREEGRGKGNNGREMAQKTILGGDLFLVVEKWEEEEETKENCSRSLLLLRMCPPSPLANIFGRLWGYYPLTLFPSSSFHLEWGQGGQESWCPQGLIVEIRSVPFCGWHPIPISPHVENRGTKEWSLDGSWTWWIDDGRRHSTSWIFGGGGMREEVSGKKLRYEKYTDKCKMKNRR
jgi:hypothetical protein